MTSIYQLMQCTAFIMVLSCHSLNSLAGVVPRAVVLSDQVKDRKGFGRNMDRLQKKKELKVLSAPTFSTTMTRLTVRVTPKNSTLPLPPRGIRFGGENLASISIRCRIKCIVEKVQDLPMVSFCLQIENETILPLSAGMPGVVELFTSTSENRMQKPFKDADNRRAVSTFRSDTHLTLNSNAYPLLRRGNNQFFCRAYSPSIGLLKSDGFIVYRQ